jgi:hypothetical protein
MLTGQILKLQELINYKKILLLKFHLTSLKKMMNLNQNGSLIVLVKNQHKLLHNG